MTASPQDLQHYRNVFFPFTQEPLRRAEANGLRFAYYTSADTATRIIANAEIWLRNATVMNDFAEIEHGFACLNAAWKGPVGADLQRVLNRLFPDLVPKVEERVNESLVLIRTDTYLACLSEHPPEEDRTGRLSMWRAYGSPNGVALVLNGGVMFRPSDALGAYSYPVLYESEDSFPGVLRNLVSSLEAQFAYVQSLGEEGVLQALYAVLRSFILCTKHPGFREEREWRVIASPLMQLTPLMRYELETIHGVPQMVVKLALRDSPAEGLTGLAAPDLLSRVIIGPCQFPLVTSKAIHQALAKAGIPKPGERIAISDIPLRSS